MEWVFLSSRKFDNGGTSPSERVFSRMPKYRFAVRSQEGKLRTGTVTEASLEAAKSRLTGAGFVIVSLQEEAELVVHEAKAPSGGARPKAERAAIIEFETTFFERVANFFNRFILRREFAAVLFALGTAFAVYQNLTHQKPPQPKQVQVTALDVEVQVEPGSLEGKGDTLVAVLPDIPFRFSQPVKAGLLMKNSFETPKLPGRVLVTLVDEDGQVLGEGEGLLSARKEGALAASVPLSPVKKKSR